MIQCAIFQEIAVSLTLLAMTEEKKYKAEIILKGEFLFACIDIFNELF